MSTSSRLPTRKPSVTPPKSHWSPQTSPEISSASYATKRRASASSVPSSSPAAAATTMPRKSTRPSTASTVPSSSSLPRLRSFKAIFAPSHKKRPSTSGTSAATNKLVKAPPGLSDGVDSSGNASASREQVDEFGMLDVTNRAPVAASTTKQRDSLQVVALRDTPSPFESAPSSSNAPSQKPSRDTLRIMTDLSSSPVSSGARQSLRSASPPPPASPSKRVSRDFVRPDNEPSLAFLRAGMTSPISLARRKRDSSSPTKRLSTTQNVAAALNAAVSDDMAYRRLSISPKPPQEARMSAESQSPSDKGLLNESPLLNVHDDEQQQVLAHHPSISSLTSAYSTAASNQPTSPASSSSLTQPLPRDSAKTTEPRPSTPDFTPASTSTGTPTAMTFASPRQARREALPPEEGSPGLASLAHMFKADDEQRNSDDLAPLGSGSPSSLRRSVSAAERGVRERHGSMQIKTGSPVLVKPLVDLTRSASVAERVNSYESAIDNTNATTREQRRALRAARSKSDIAIGAAQRSSRISAETDRRDMSNGLRPMSDPQRPIASPLDNLIRDLSESANFAVADHAPAEATDLSTQSPSLFVRPPSGASVAEPTLQDVDISPKTRIRGSMTVEEMESEIARMEAELAVASGSPSAPSRQQLEAAPSSLPRPPPDAPSASMSRTSTGTMTDVTPRTARKWSIVEVEQAYSRMKELLGSTKSAGYSESAWSEAGDVDVEHAFERAIGHSDSSILLDTSLASTSITSPSSSLVGTPLVSELGKFPLVPSQSGVARSRETTSTSDSTQTEQVNPDENLVRPVDDALTHEEAPFSGPSDEDIEREAQVDDVFAIVEREPARAAEQSPPTQSTLTTMRTNESLRSTMSGSESGGEGWMTPLTSPVARYGKVSMRATNGSKRALPAVDDGHGAPRDMPSLATILDNGPSNLGSLPEHRKGASLSNGSSKLGSTSTTVDTWFPATPARLPHRRANRGLGFLSSDNEQPKPSSLLSIRSMDKLEIYFKYTAAKAELDRAGLERDALLDALDETRVALEDVRAQRDAISDDLRRERLASRHLKKYLGNESTEHAGHVEDLVRASQLWEARARDAAQELEIARTEAEALAQMVLESREREEQLEHDNLVMAAKLANLERGRRASQTESSTTTGRDYENFAARRRTPSRDSTDVANAIDEVGESPLMTQRMTFGPKSSFGSIASPLKSRKENGQGSPTVTLSRIAALSAARKASLDRQGLPVSDANDSNARPQNGHILHGHGISHEGKRHVSNASTASTTSDFGDHLPPRDWLAGSRRGKLMGELDEADERFLSDLTSQ